MDFDVTVRRNDYIGGSDIPCIMGISSFKTRYELLLEKAGLKEIEFTSNKYTVYGQELEPQIRTYINSKMPFDKQFVPNRVYKDDLRCHTDGFNGECVLEIKTTSDIHDSVDGYKVYLVQLLLYMQINGVEKGLLAVYDRPDDFNTVFDSDRLATFPVDINDYQILLTEINAEIDRFRGDLARLKENPLLSEQDFQPNELVAAANKVLAFETKLAQFRVIEQQYNEMKQALFEAMQTHDVKSWQTVNGVKITRVDPTGGTTKIVKEFNADLFATEHPELYEQYVVEKEKTTPIRKGYVKITLPKADA
ncbi:MAG: YqaJ viral recombinase family protein [Clostridia bacterium]|nr:YqaJ viral recombinase family protein [Clostridia bacterium]